MKSRSPKQSLPNALAVIDSFSDRVEFSQTKVDKTRPKLEQKSFNILLKLPKRLDMAVPVIKDGKPDKQFFEVKVDTQDLGKPDSLRYSILTWVLDERYDRAIDELKDFIDSPSEYPNFKAKITRFVNHSIDLIYAIKAKRSFPGINSLTRAKQQELREKFKEHFRELQYVLKIIEKIHADLRVRDVRSTIYVVQALWLAVLGIIIVAFSMEIFHGLAKTAMVVFDDSFGHVANWLADHIGF